VTHSSCILLRGKTANFAATRIGRGSSRVYRKAVPGIKQTLTPSGRFVPKACQKSAFAGTFSATRGAREREDLVMISFGPFRACPGWHKLCSYRRAFGSARQLVFFAKSALRAQRLAPAIVIFDF
jgi:hypothetical protein